MFVLRKYSKQAIPFAGVAPNQDGHYLDARIFGDVLTDLGPTLPA